MKRIVYFLLGLLFGFLLGRWQSASPVTAPSAPPTRPPAPTPKPPVKEPDTPDDLTEIDGIGPAFAEALRAIGIVTFRQLAAQNPETLAEQMGGRVTAARIRRNAWIEQARERITEGNS